MKRRLAMPERIQDKEAIDNVLPLPPTVLLVPWKWGIRYFDSSAELEPWCIKENTEWKLYLRIITTEVASI